MIIASAIKLKDERVFVGKRHGDCFHNMLQIMSLEDINSPLIANLIDGCTCGFITDSLVFLNRKDAYIEAYKCGQCKEQVAPDKKREEELYKIGLTEPWDFCLASEDLWK